MFSTKNVTTKNTQSEPRIYYYGIFMKDNVNNIKDMTSKYKQFLTLNVRFIS